MVITNKLVITDNIIQLFQSHNYEKYVLDIMNASKQTFPEAYEMIENQACGECDFIAKESGKKFDAKIPFETKQIKLLTSGKKHEPQILEWIKQLQDEESDFNPLEIRDNPSYDIADTKLYTIMKNQIERDKGDENIVFFLPYPMVLSVETSIFMQFCSDYLRAIYDRMKTDIDLSGRDIFVIYPSSEKNKFALRNLRQWNIEFVNYNELESYFSYEVVNVE